MNRKFYQPNIFLGNRHISTIIPALYRKSYPIYNHRQEFILEDDDFIDVDWITNGSSKLIIIIHGLEGSSHRHYVVSLANQFKDIGFDVAAINLRSCSGRPNRGARLYHSGDTSDFRYFLNSPEVAKYSYIGAAGFSAGGNIILNYGGAIKLSS